MNEVLNEIAEMRGMGYEDIVIHAAPSALARLLKDKDVPTKTMNNVRTVRHTLMGLPMWESPELQWQIVVEARDVAKFPIKRRGLTKQGEWTDVAPV